MSREEADREDLMEEAVQLIHRLQIVIADRPDPVIAGRRATGAWSFYFGAEPVYQFDVEGRLRRAYIDGHLYRSQGTTVARLARSRTATETTLQRHDLTPDELQEMQTRCRNDLTELRNALWEDRFEISRYVGFDLSPRSAVSDALYTILTGGIRLAPAIASRPD